MPYKLRLEFPGAIYHVINRGNYRRWIFEESGAKAAFETCLFEACKRCEWLLHAFVIMSNHFHLALETPRGNLVAGMQWLESTYANRFNRFRNERDPLVSEQLLEVLKREIREANAAGDFDLLISLAKTAQELRELGDELLRLRTEIEVYRLSSVINPQFPGDVHG